jgi:hypothetical protein
MKLEWRIEPSDIQLIQRVVAQQRHSRVVADRIERNVEDAPLKIDRDKLWQTQVMCLLTSRQRSGPNSPVSSLLNQKPFPLSLRKCQEAKDVKAFVSLTLRDFGGIQFYRKIGERAAANLRKLESGGWSGLECWMERLKAQRLQPPKPSHYQLERQAAKHVIEYEGFGPKQSRNFWQTLGLTRYEFVLDSRITNWLREAKFPLPLSSAALSDEAYYVFLSDILRELCIKANVLPCILDAAVFSSYV